ncbi:hypothetical protein MPNT_60049 [Candidatus Methylacidithermus pantelleriae]|uniref:Uncharacterized protein n=1 Tax=Candidatus Methylacidithermus pantelleriae TaxID=2744239 RepID=A0A8J2BLN5_9BACT|nr:hypothetical protein MPNT_60049 [Candidatus Methylacidithermus pantelleriae]
MNEQASTSGKKSWPKRYFFCHNGGSSVLMGLAQRLVWAAKRVNRPVGRKVFPPGNDWSRRKHLEELSEVTRELEGLSRKGLESGRIGKQALPQGGRSNQTLETAG